MKTTRRVAALAVMAILAMLFAVFSSGCGTEEVDPDAVGLKYTSGALEGKKFDSIIEPGETKFEINDKVYQIPISQRSFRIEQDEDADINGKLVVPAGGSDALRVAFELAVAFKLNTWTDPIKGYKGGMAQKFYEELCRRYKCELDDGKTPPGWRLLLKDKLYTALQAAFKDEARRFNPDNLVNNVAQPVEVDGETIQRPAQEILLEAVGQRFLVTLERQTGGRYFCGPTFDRTAQGDAKKCPPVELLISSVDFENPEVQRSRENKKVAQDQVEAADTVEKSLKKRGFLEYQKIQACRETRGTCVIGLSGVGISAR